MTSSTWQDVVRQVQNHRDRTLTLIQPPIPKLPTELPRNVTALPQTLLSPREAEITTTTAEDLVASLGTGRLTSTEVTNAFLRRAGLAQNLVSTLSVIFVVVHLTLSRPTASRNSCPSELSDEQKSLTTI